MSIKILDSIKKRLKLPAIVAPMFLVSGPESVIQSCKEGLMGSFPGPNARTIEDLRSWFGKYECGLHWGQKAIDDALEGRLKAS